MKELKRVLLDRTTLFMLFLLTVVGSVLFWLSTQRSVYGKEYPAAYDTAYRDLLEQFEDSDGSEEEIARLYEVSERAQTLGSIATMMRMGGFEDEIEDIFNEYPEYREAYESGELQKYSDNVYLSQAERAAVDVLKEQLAYIKEFNDYYPTIKRNADRMQHTSIFGDPNSFAYRNTIKTVKDFASIDGATATIGDDRSITAIFADPRVDYLMLLFLAAVSLVMLKERKSGLWQLVRATPRGRARLGFDRIVTMFFAALLATVFIFGSRVVLAYYRYDGLASGTRLIQSIAGFNGITKPMSANTFMLIYFGIKLACTFGAGLLLYLLLSAVKNTNIAIAITALVLAFEFTLYSTVRDSSILVPFKYINIFQLIVPRNFTVNYLNLNVFEHPLNVRVAVSIVMTVLAIAAAVGILLIHVYKRPGGKPNPLEKLIDRIRRRTYKNVFMQETGKVMFAQRCIVVLAVLVYIFVKFDSLPNPSVTDYQQSTRSYYEKYAGSVSEETLASLDEDMARVEEQMSACTDSFLISTYQRTLDGLEMMKYDVQDIIDRNASGEYKREILLLPPYTYMIVFGDGSQQFQVSQGLKALLCICLLTAGMYAYERQSSMRQTLRALPGGRKKLYLRKELITLVFSLLVFAAVYLPEIIAEATSPFYGGFAYFNYPVQGLEICREWHIPMSVGTLTVILYVIRFIFIFITGSAVGLLSSLSERVNTAMVLVCAVLVVPACIVAMGVMGLYNYTPLPSLWVAGALFYGGALPVCIYAVIALAAAGYNCYLNCGAKTRLRKE